MYSQARIIVRGGETAQPPTSATRTLVVHKRALLVQEDGEKALFALGEPAAEAVGLGAIPREAEAELQGVQLAGPARTAKRGSVKTSWGGGGNLARRDNWPLLHCMRNATNVCPFTGLHFTVRASINVPHDGLCTVYLNVDCI